ncbi:Phosphoribosylformylglycinamidine synthase subunit PurL [Anatilimnocola aggregata]|uniref:Phosphoribosylformylglycinamidine synthase subunit PurL n=1 Tax=Anatilimnocola aggregata TaxID=2528021 RepID=A0A517YA74_9BACT|nr:phosphoribosylformylglycinamidine synthase subunit PurL [Anatilimnocola aggregata]QDU27135.1 Phosphoribosylformylglycinamidine synthase subunit PurL [Anatilimnocola aggregata]
MTLWEIDLHPAAGERDLLATAAVSQAADLGLGSFRAAAVRGFLLEADFTQSQVEQLARELLADLVVEQPVVAKVGEAVLLTAPSASGLSGKSQLVHVLPKPGVTDPVAASTLTAIADFGLKADAVVTLRKYWLADLDSERIQLLIKKLLANDSIEQAVVGPLDLKQLHVGAPGKFELQTVPIRELSSDQLVALSRARTLSLTLVEMQTIQQHFRDLDREPTDIELESIAQTWSEHCSHKTLAGRVHYRDEQGDRYFNNMLKETIFAATQKIRASLGANDWCVSVFKDNAGVIKFNDDFHICFKVETHNRPSAIEPYGGANTGVGGVIRDTLGTGLGAKPICNTDVFCFAPPDMPAEQLPPGVLHPRRIMRGVVSGVRDYGNRMGIPTVNGAIYFDERYVGNPLVFCGNVGLIPVDKAAKETQPGDLIVAIGGRTGRDGIHGATFSSVELTSQSEKVSGGAVQIGNAITEKMVLDVLLQARDEGLYTAVTDCGAGGFSSAVGEMGADIGAEVWLDKAPLKYDGLSYVEIWISEAQERMVFSVPEKHWPRFEALCAAENVEAVALGKFTPTGNLTLKYQGQKVGELAMEFLHEGRPKVERQAVYSPRSPVAATTAENSKLNHEVTLLKLLGSLNVASKEWVIRQYDHEVQGGSVIKPLTGAANDGPSDAAVLRPVLDSRKGIVVSCGMNPRLGDFDPYHMAASAIDEAVRNCVAVGADATRIAILDNFCWGYTDRPETLGELVRAALACHDLALALGTPFISGKDSLNNEYSYDADGTRKTISIPSTLLISALGQVADVSKCVTMDLKSPGNLIYLVGNTHDELAGSHLHLVAGVNVLGDGACGSEVPKVNGAVASATFRAVHAAIQAGTVRACHDLSEGGLAVAIAEMAFAGNCGANISLTKVPTSIPAAERNSHFESVLLYSESNTRFLLEVPTAGQAAFEAALSGVPHAVVGEVTSTGRLVVTGQAGLLIDAALPTLKEAWQEPLRW